MLAIEDVKFDERGLVPAVVQDAQTGEVLTLAFMNRESLARTLREGETWFWSRSRQSLWHKGATSGHTQRVVEVKLDCDCDALVMLVEPRGPACHTGARSCFNNSLEAEQATANQTNAGEAKTVHADESNVKARQDLGAILQQLYAAIEQRRREMPAGSYTTYLFEQGLDKILKKVGEEAAETIIAAKNEDAGALISEATDLIYHLLVLLVERNVSLDGVRDELAARVGKQSRKRSGA